MSKINDGGPAYPLHPEVFDWQGQAGMTLRDYFAAQALPAILAATSAQQHMPIMQPGERELIPAMVRDAYAVADAMLAARAKGGNADAGN